MSSFKRNLNSALRLVRQVAAHRNKYGDDPFYNNKWRELCSKKLLMVTYGVSEKEIILGKKVNGIDFEWPRRCISKGEMKSQWLDGSLSISSLGGMAFDKQNDPIRRKAIYDYDGLVYSLFKRDGTIEFALIILGIENTKLVHPLMKLNQDEKTRYYAECEQLGKRIGRDDIVIKAYDVLNILEDANMTLVYQGQKISKQVFLDTIQEST